MSDKREQIKPEIIRAAQKNPARFSVIYDRFYKPVFVFVYKRIGDEEVTADITSQVFLKALLNLKKYEYRGVPFSSWLFRIAVNEVNLHYRKSKKQVFVPVLESDLSVLAEEFELPQGKNNQALMVDTLNELPEEQSQMIELRFFENYSFRDLGHHYKITEDNAKVRVYRILKKMKKIITLKAKGQG